MKLPWKTMFYKIFCILCHIYLLDSPKETIWVLKVLFPDTSGGQRRIERLMTWKTGMTTFKVFREKGKCYVIWSVPSSIAKPCWFLNDLFLIRRWSWRFQKLFWLRNDYKFDFHIFKYTSSVWLIFVFASIWKVYIELYAVEEVGWVQNAAWICWNALVQAQTQ